MPIIKHQKTKTLAIRPNDRSSDFVTPNFIYGCAGGCRNSYCYVMRYNYDHIYINDNSDQILASIAKHAESLSFPKAPNQVDPAYWTYDIGCSTDIALHWKHYDWLMVFDFFKNHPKLKATFATKYVNESLLTYQANRKIRIRFSLMPQSVSSILEPKTSPIKERIQAIEHFYNAGFDVHINFSPIVVYDTWLADYQDLFNDLNRTIAETIKPCIKAEGIFLTHNEWQHHRNLERGFTQSEDIIWQPEFQEQKRSQYGSEAVRYHHHLKTTYIHQWRNLHQQIIPWNEIRYLF